MKIIFSRKGFDSSAGGCASPILDNQLVSLPIPDPDSPISYADVHHDAVGSLGPVVESLTRGRVAGSSGAHLDPDMDGNAIARRPGWMPIFGQVDSAQSHLLNRGVRVGDLFLMFGWFRRARLDEGGARFIAGAPDLHVIYGWFQIGSVIELGRSANKAAHPAWTHYHPHFYGDRAANNVLYVAAPTLVLDGVDTGVPGAGRWKAFAFDSALQLTDPSASVRGTWKLPTWFDPSRTPEPLSYHADADRWQRLDDGHQLRSAGRGQEFVFDTAVYPEAIDWVNKLLSQREALAGTN